MHSKTSSIKVNLNIKEFCIKSHQILNFCRSLGNQNKKKESIVTKMKRPLKDHPHLKQATVYVSLLSVFVSQRFRVLAIQPETSFKPLV